VSRALQRIPSDDFVPTSAPAAPPYLSADSESRSVTASATSTTTSVVTGRVLRKWVCVVIVCVCVPLLM
jgi:hypothetical protein